ncbi:MAG: heme A synthase [Gammaproteobacteria bacterium]|nr:heme A synthase [Gammaproteobacteria bacterium]NIR83463.1 heme A synthase [Gammaproteobacteria bacterium]NIR91385.1 heme A synthase [Gammaproteobacteria bacterium]NIU04625.1 heme A synthase [Gammaproteobacteria bacterium]NIV51667.1 heme A synthase [Gammaproteobacteria bacterium]
MGESLPAQVRASPSRAQLNRRVGAWLLVCCAMVAIMVVLGGVTRLTHSGLSMVDWRPVTGWLPPLSQGEWEAAFRAYQGYPEYQKLNLHMTLDGFKSIFWLEYVHRLWGRLIGVAFLLPFLYFAVRGYVDRWLWPRLAGAFVLGALQGLLGWYMVKSGLVDRPDVSHYRLAAHLGLAFLIYGYLFYLALGLLVPPPSRAHQGALPTLRVPALLVLALVFVTVIYGAFVAGLDAGFVYNTFPLMGGELVPGGLLALEPPLRNLFENVVTVQFAHRVLAMTTLLAIVALWWRARRLDVPARVRTTFHALLGVGIVQVALGITALVLVVPATLGAAHQAGALALLSAALWALHEQNRAIPPAAAAV